MKELTSHIVEGDSANHQLTIKVKDSPGQGGANHLYEITGFDISSNASKDQSPHDGTRILFQNGPIAEFGVNGLTQEALLAIVIDRLECFQTGPFACEDNGIALGHIKVALNTLQNRTRARIARGVEGTNRK